MPMEMHQRRAFVLYRTFLEHRAHSAVKIYVQYQTASLSTHARKTLGQHPSTTMFRVNEETASRLFLLQQRLMWPNHYYPSNRIAHLLQPGGASLQEILDIFRALRGRSDSEVNVTTPIINDSSNSNSSCYKSENKEHTNTNDKSESEATLIRRDLEADKLLWMQCGLADFIRSLVPFLSLPARSHQEKQEWQSLLSKEQHKKIFKTAIRAEEQEEEEQEWEEHGKKELKMLSLQRKFYKLTCRDRTLHDAEIRKLFDLCAYASPELLSESLKCHTSKGNTSVNNSFTERKKSINVFNSLDLNNSKREMEIMKPTHYKFTPFAHCQELAMQPVCNAKNLHDRVTCSTFPQVHNLLNANYHSMTALRMLHYISGDEIVPSTELVQTLAMYLNRRIIEIRQQEERESEEQIQQQLEYSKNLMSEEENRHHLLRRAIENTREESQKQESRKEECKLIQECNNANKEGVNESEKSSLCKEEEMEEQKKNKNSSKYSSRRCQSIAWETPVVFFFTNGRLPYLINKTKILPFEVQAIEKVQRYCETINSNHTADEKNSSNISRDSLLHKTNLSSQGVLGKLIKAITERRLRLVRSVMKFATMNINQEQKNNTILEELTSKLWSPTFFALFKSEHLSVHEALMKYKPAIAVVEPHISRDFLCDIRGFYSIREVVMLGPIDSPVMGSFTNPYLTFGVMPSANTYWEYNAWMKPIRISSSAFSSETEVSPNALKLKMQTIPSENKASTHNDTITNTTTNTNAANDGDNNSNGNNTTCSLLLSSNITMASSLPSITNQTSMPKQMRDTLMDPPYAQQGYTRQYIDSISSYLISPNDTNEAPNQYRCLSFRRIKRPIF